MLEFLYDILFQPRQAMARIGSEKRMAQAVATFLIGAVLPNWIMYYTLQGTPVFRLFEAMTVVHLLGSALLWFLSAAAWHLFAELLGGSGKATDLFVALGFTYFPRIFILPVAVVAALLPSTSGAVWIGLFGMIIAIWTTYLNVLAISGVHGLSRSRAFIVLLMPLLILSGVLCVLIFMFGLSLLQVPWLQG